MLQILGLPSLVLLAAVAAAAEPEPSYHQLQLERGQWIYEQRCVACHEREGRGLIGPNLTDWTFLHGGSRDDLKRVLLHGVPERGMPAWDQVLDRGELHAVLVYVWSLRGRELPGKAPQGLPLPPAQR